MIPNKMPPQKAKDPKVVQELFKIVNSKIDEIKMLKYLLKENQEDDRILKALIHSNKVMIEDILREAGYMLPQSKNSHDFLEDIKANGDDTAKDIAAKLLDKIEVNE